MSSSFLKPDVTPCTALATSARASPCKARCSSVARRAVSTPSFCSKVMPCGIAKESLPFGPCTSILPVCRAIFTPAGTGIGLRPIRDIYSSLFKSLPSWAQHAAPLQTRLPDFAKNLAAHFGLARRTAAHQPLRRGHDADAQPAYDGTNVGRAEIRTGARARDALQAGDHAAAVRGVLQENAQHLTRLVLVHQLVGRDVALVLEDARNLGLELRDRNIDALVLGGRRVAEARQKIGNGIRLHNSPKRLLPAGFHDAGDFSLQRHTAETDTAHLELADIPARAAADAAAVAYPHLEFRFFERLGDFCCACHLLRHSFFAKRKPEPLEQLAALLIIPRGGGHGDVHALDLVYAGVIDFRKYQLIL